MVTDFQSPPSFETYFRTEDALPPAIASEQKEGSSFLFASTLIIGIGGIILIYYLMTKNNQLHGQLSFMDRKVKEG